MENNSQILINLLGTGYDLAIGLLGDQQSAILELAVKQEGRCMNELLFDPEFYQHYSVPNSNAVGSCNSWQDFGNLASYRGPGCFEAGHMEIWINKRKVKICKFRELFGNLSLFPLFDIVKNELPPSFLSSPDKHIVIGVQEKGHLARYKFTCNGFVPAELKIEHLHIRLMDRNLVLISALSYAGTQLISTKEDTVITGTLLNTLH